MAGAAAASPGASFKTRMTQKTVLFLSSYGSASSTSTFQKTGKLTPDEFVRAGDYLVENFPTWKWCSGVDDKKRAHLPPDKQYLVTRDVPAMPPPDVSGPAVGEDGVVMGVVDNMVEDDWVATGDVTTHGGDDDVAEKVEELQPDTETTAPTDDDDGDDDDDDVESLDNFDYTESAVKEVDTAALASGAAAAGAGEETFMSTRTYDVHVTYDTYYSTPRVWFFGYDAEHEPLKGADWQNDFSPEHVNKTVTHEAHPHEGFSCPSIHPCKHAAAMLRMITLALGGQEGELDVKFYLLIFLKFIQTIVPNIEYDHTGQFQLSGGTE
eukprot:m.76762 g.76762  ORF g.76762 m.76762 type:complete len:324 (+) comp19054_c0_seq1:68-1039(+)